MKHFLKETFVFYFFSSNRQHFITKLPDYTWNNSMHVAHVCSPPPSPEQFRWTLESVPRTHFFKNMELYKSVKVVKSFVCTILQMSVFLLLICISLPVWLDNLSSLWTFITTCKYFYSRFTLCSCSIYHQHDCVCRLAPCELVNVNLE